MVYAISLPCVSTACRAEKRKHAAMVEHKAGRFLLKYALTKEYGVKLSEYEIIKNEYGKPYFKERPDIFFNISHCSSMVVCILGSNPVGIDVEVKRSYKENLLKKVFSEKEQKRIMAARKSGKDDLEFIKFWTFKEAYGKAIGKGMLYNYRDMSFIAEGNKVTCPDDECQMWYTVINEEMVISVCRKQKESFTEDIEFLAKNIDELEV